MVQNKAFTEPLAAGLLNIPLHSLISWAVILQERFDFSKRTHCYSEGLLRTLWGGGGSSKNQNNLTKIGCLVTQTLRQLTHMVPYFKHEEIDAVFIAWCC